SRRRHTISKRDWSSDVCSSDLGYCPCWYRPDDRNCSHSYVRWLWLRRRLCLRFRWLRRALIIMQWRPSGLTARQRTIFGVIAIMVAVFVVLSSLRLTGLLICLIILPLALFMLYSRPDASEQKTLRSSISLSADDIEDVAEEFEHFAH